jgi:hypothetical protein
VNAGGERFRCLWLYEYCLQPESLPLREAQTFRRVGDKKYVRARGGWGVGNQLDVFTSSYNPETTSDSARPSFVLRVEKAPAQISSTHSNSPRQGRGTDSQSAPPLSAGWARRSLIAR